MSKILSRERIGIYQQVNDQMGDSHTLKEILDNVLSSHEDLRVLLREIDDAYKVEGDEEFNCRLMEALR